MRISSRRRERPGETRCTREIVNPLCRAHTARMHVRCGRLVQGCAIRVRRWFDIRYTFTIAQAIDRPPLHWYRSVPHGANSSLLRTLHTPWYTPSRVGEHRLSASPTIVVVFLSPGRNPLREKEREKETGTESVGERSIFILFPRAR